jgi:hypothetical protein
MPGDHDTALQQSIKEHCFSKLVNKSYFYPITLLTLSINQMFNKFHYTEEQKLK